VFSTLLGNYQGVGLLDCKVRVCLVFQKTTKLSSKVAVPFCIATISEREFIDAALHSCQHLVLSAF